MLHEFAQHFGTRFRTGADDRFLLAISAGVDSVVLAHLLHKSGHRFELGHCNFGLRGKESDADEKFCEKLAAELGVPFHSRAFDVTTHCAATGQSVQMAARELRYGWLLQILKERKLDYLLTAHHANDLAETMLLNLVRGTGVNGMKGIPEQNGPVIRPLLPFTKAELIHFATSEKLQYREDRSNTDTKYDRNFMRLKVIPLLRELNPSIENTFLKNARRFGQEAGIVGEYLARRASRLIREKDGFIRINAEGLLREKYRAAVLHHLLRPYGFTETQESNIESCLVSDAPSGRLFYAPEYQLTIAREELVIRHAPGAAGQVIAVKSNTDLKRLSFLKVVPQEKFTKPGPSELLIHPSKLQFPLLIRQPERGDRFMPFGMKGFKLISDFLKEQKLNAFEKESVRLLVNGNGDIIWVMGLRSDERYRVSPTASGVIRLKLLGKP